MYVYIFKHWGQGCYILNFIFCLIQPLIFCNFVYFKSIREKICILFTNWGKNMHFPPFVVPFIHIFSPTRYFSIFFQTEKYIALFGVPEVNLHIQGVEFKSAHFLIFLRNGIKWYAIKIFTPNKKQNGPDGLDQRWLNLHGSMQWYIIQSRHVQKIHKHFDEFFFSQNFHFFRGCKNWRKLEKKKLFWLFVNKKKKRLLYY